MTKPTANTPDILCIGSVLWDLPGGVAMNIAMTLKRFGLTPALLTAIGQDANGHDLITQAQSMGLITDHVYRSEDLPTDVYMAIEGANGLVAAIADAHSLEASGAKVLRALENGDLGSAQAPFSGPIALDGNLTEDLLHQISVSPLFAAADLRVAPASPGKANRLLALLGHPSATLYVNVEEAGLLCQTTFTTARDAVHALCTRGARRVLVTNGGDTAAEGTATDVIEATPPSVMVTRVTGAGDTFMAAHIASEVQGMDRTAALPTRRTWKQRGW